MNTYATSITDTSMILQDDGTWCGTILAEKHGLGSSAFVVRAVRRNADSNFENLLCSYETDGVGNINIYTSEPTSLRVTIGQGIPVTTNSIMGEGEENADS